ncbi:MAG: adenosylcobinamide-GDP ribazoletransferase [Dehalococcoidia bacterium]
MLRFLTILPAPASDSGAGNTRLAAPPAEQRSEHTPAEMKTVLLMPETPAADEELRSVGRSTIYFPLVGLVIGLLLVLLYIVFRAALPTPVSCVLLIGALAVITGAHHIDGLMDTCDAFAAGKTMAQRLEIMKDTRVGAFGITAAILVLLTKYICLSATIGVYALLTFPILSRWAITGLVLVFPSARDSGSFYALKSSASRDGFIGASVIALAAAILLNGMIIGPLIMLGLFGLLYCLGVLFSRLFGGLTGDCCGALIESGEVITLVLSIASLRLMPYLSSYNLFKITIPF